MLKYFIFSLPKTISRCFSGYNLLWQIGAMIITYFLIITNADWYYFVHTRINTILLIFSSAPILGGLFPIVMPISFILSGYITGNKKIGITGWAMGQAVFLGSGISSFYKFFTGRIQPNLTDITTNITHNFNFGFYEHGIFWGWPSSHTTIAFAMVFALISLFPKHKIAGFFAILYAFYIGIGVSFSIHWLSDCIAGAIVGIIVGTSVALSYKAILKNAQEDSLIMSA